jgi:hypothetical protein
MVNPPALAGLSVTSETSGRPRPARAAVLAFAALAGLGVAALAAGRRAA